MTTQRTLDPLNGPQREAVAHRDGPLLVVAGPGSGKTRVITHRVAYLVESGVGPENILAITFTNKAAGEMRERAEQLLNLRMPWISTFHSFAARLLRRHIYRIPPFTTAFSIYDSDDSIALIKQCVKSLDVSSSLVTPRSLRSEISALKNRGVEDPQVIPETADLHDRIVRQVFARYVRSLEERNALDFDDLLLFLVRLFKTQPDVLDYYQRQFRYVLIDEYQDTNHIQYTIGRLLSHTHRNLCVTGDPDQSIYSWRGADIANILSFERDFDDARVVRLEQNYRSTKRILRAANAVISLNQNRKEKDLWTENPEGDPVRVYRFRDGEEEAREIANLVEQFRDEGLNGDQIAIFYRINSLSRELEQAFVVRGISYNIVGSIEFFQRKEIKDLVAYLRILVNPRDIESLRRILNVPTRGIGRTTEERIVEAAAQSQRTPLEVILSADLRPAKTKRIANALGGFADLYHDLAELPRSPVADLVTQVYERTGYRDALRSLPDEEESERVANVEELINAAAQFDTRQPDGHLEGFLQELALFTSVDRWQPGDDRVTLMTLHSAKGLEFPIVIICGLEEGLLPLRRADDDGTLDDEEERRLFFVGVTRAQKKLYVTHAEDRMRFGRSTPSTPSEFLRELMSSEEGTVEVDAGTTRSLERSRGLSAAFEWDELDETSSSGDEDWDELLDEDPYPMGARVRHEEFGEGIVASSNGFGKNRRLTIQFEAAGKKTIVLGYARLDRLP